MKHLKKLSSLLLAVFMVLAMGTASVFAEDSTATITVTDSSDTHTYNVYQIFTGDLQSDGSLANIKWGTAGTGTAGEAVDAAVITALEEIDASASDSTKLATINKYVSASAATTGTVKAGNPLTVPTGYYILKDADNLEGKDDAYTTYIVVVAGPVEITRKAAQPTVDKQVQDEVDDAEANSEDGWGETADHEINEKFQFKLTAALPDDKDLDAYSAYKLVFHDTLSKGIAYDGNLVVTVNGTAVSDSSKYSVSTSETVNGTVESTITVTIPDLKQIVTDIKNATVVVTYDAHLTTDAVVGNDPSNKNKVYLEYSNNPENAGTGTPGTGKTPEDTVFVFTYKVDNKKTDDLNRPLKKAKFALYSTYDADTKTGTPVALYYSSEKTAYVPVKNSGNTAVEYMVSDGDNAIFNIIGLDAGTYYLVETEAPEGYQLAAPITITISATHSENDDGESAVTVIDQEKSTGLDNTVVDTKNTSLPTTGGIGTTLFYVFGGILVAVAGVLLIAKKRMSAE